jgi:DNA-directed RNA polymerase specialized sigma24 family protein
MKLNPEGWVGEHGTIMYRYVLARCGRPDVAENLVQEAFVSGLRSRDSFTGRSSERTWLMGILKHKLMDYYRKKSRESSMEDVEAMPDSVQEMFERNGGGKSRRRIGERLQSRPSRTATSGAFCGSAWGICPGGRLRFSLCVRWKASKQKTFVRNWGSPRPIFG